MNNIDYIIDYSDIGKRIKGARLENKMQQEKLAELSNISVTHISNIENGKTKLSLPAILKIANALSISMDELLCGNLLHGKKILESELSSIVFDCSIEEIKIITNIVKALKDSLRGKM